MKKNYYMLINDRKSEFQPIFLSGILDVVEGGDIPVKCANMSFPYDAYDIGRDEFFWNFNESEEFEFDYREDHGHIVSAQFIELLKDFFGAPHQISKLTIWMNGKKMDYDYYYVIFDRGTWQKGVQLNKELVFYDVEESDFQRGRRGGIVPTGKIVLTANADKYDFFQLLDTSTLSRVLLVSEKIKDNIESMGLKGIKIVPLSEAFQIYCKENRISIERLLPKVKKSIP